jgi:hypothetical protein
MVDIVFDDVAGAGEAVEGTGLAGVELGCYVAGCAVVDGAGVGLGGFYALGDEKGVACRAFVVGFGQGNAWFKAAVKLTSLGA